MASIRRGKREGRKQGRLDLLSNDRELYEQAVFARSATERIAEDIDFKPYLDSVNAGSTRTRAALYILVAACIAILAAFRSTSNPDYLDSRVGAFQKAFDCFTAGRVDPSCMDARNYAWHFLYTDD